MYSPVQTHKKWDITRAAKKWEWSTRIREDREDKEDEVDKKDEKMIKLVTQHIPTMTNSHHGGILSVMMMVGICQWQNPTIDDDDDDD